MSHDDTEARDDSGMFGIWPSLAGLGFGIVIIGLMFALATGFR